MIGRISHRLSKGGKIVTLGWMQTFIFQQNLMRKNINPPNPVVTMHFQSFIVTDTCDIILGILKENDDNIILCFNFILLHGIYYVYHY
jgi:hypothetical protein